MGRACPGSADGLSQGRQVLLLPGLARTRHDARIRFQQEGLRRAAGGPQAHRRPCRGGDLGLFDSRVGGEERDRAPEPRRQPRRHRQPERDRDMPSCRKPSPALAAQRECSHGGRAGGEGLDWMPPPDSRQRARRMLEARADAQPAATVAWVYRGPGIGWSSLQTILIGRSPSDDSSVAFPRNV